MFVHWLMPLMPVFRNPITSHTVVVNNRRVFWGALLLGPVFFFLIGDFGHGLANLVLSALLWFFFLGWVVWIRYAFEAPGIVRDRWIYKGYVEE